MFIVSLIEEDIFAIIALCGILLEDALIANTVLLAQSLPKLIANCTSKLVSTLLNILNALLTYSGYHIGQLVV